jgi:hypothetical protein
MGGDHGEFIMVTVRPTARVILIVTVRPTARVILFLFVEIGQVAPHRG